MTIQFVRPLYRSLHNSKVGDTVARETFEANYEMYHPIAQKMVANDLGVNLANLMARNAPSKSKSNNLTQSTAESSKVPPSMGVGAGAGGSSGAAAEDEDSSLFLPTMAIAAISVAAVVAFNVFKRR